MMGGNSKFYPALGRLVMLRGLVCFFHFGGTGNHQGKSIIMGGLPTPCETMGGVCLARLVVVVRSLPLVGGVTVVRLLGGLPSWGQEKMVGGFLTPLHTMFIPWK